MKPIYLDHAATTPVHDEVIEAMVPVYQTIYGNPSSVHQFGRKARNALDQARRTAARSIGAKEKEIVFTSGGTEADNLAIIGTVLANQGKGKHVITTEVEHHASLHAAQYLEQNGFEITYLPVYEDGRIRIDDLEASLREDTVLVSIMMVNNETGAMQPIMEIAELLASHQAYFHSDIVQAYGLIEINVTELPVDLLAVSSHKINGPKGIGFLYIREGTPMQSLAHGGEQERKRRAGTENVPGIVGFQKAIELTETVRSDRKERYSRYKQIFLEELSNEAVDYQINGIENQTIETIVNISFPNMNVEALLTNFDLSGIAASSGSACTAGSVEPSHVLTAMYGKGDARTVNSVRFSFGIANHEENVKEAAQRISQIIKRLK
ncbi:cysteine desulfurase family protein [Halobacillus naozhouensis]|uniref:cysteine desulfurase n=1 Tax=Halobacillus naozhouensis TaxID=554880 RepID=A0ABY8ITI6_9BACI|nr:cysteine desulfurase family protein [Halobacillus naozhouensis]WFT73348.1 cysteine desulfurase family protein [Halobacillus naozhouensis]